MKVPRSLLPPPPKQKSKWEDIALKSGIAPSVKRSRKVYAESTGDWKHLTGSLSNKANIGPESWPIVEKKKNDDPSQDPWEQLREEKKAWTGKNTVSQMKNAERAGTLDRGRANRLMKHNACLEKQRLANKEKLQKQGVAASSGVPMDGQGGRYDALGGKTAREACRRRHLPLRRLRSRWRCLGRFDCLREG
jgi:hypothetical protein